MGSGLQMCSMDCRIACVHSIQHLCEAFCLCRGKWQEERQEEEGQAIDCHTSYAMSDHIGNTAVAVFTAKRPEFVLHQHDDCGSYLS